MGPEFGEIYHGRLISLLKMEKARWDLHNGTFGIWTNKSERGFCERRNIGFPKALKRGRNWASHC